jgi:hypothetical protein
VSKHCACFIQRAIPLYSWIDLKQIERNSGKTGAIGREGADKAKEGWVKGKGKKHGKQ